MFLVFFHQVAFAQEDTSRCGVFLPRPRPGETSFFELSEKAFAQFRAKHTTFARLESNQDTFIIPVVVHIIYNKPKQYFSLEQVQRQIDVLNQDYRRRNSDTSLAPLPFRILGGDAGFHFRLAKQDPQGNHTTGVVYTPTATSVFEPTDGMKFKDNGGSNVWDPSHYLNIWVCPLNPKYLGYTSPDPKMTSIDGVVIRSDAFGIIGSEYYDRGRTTTHEVGHYFGLMHPWGPYENSECESDQVEDTPLQKNASPLKRATCPTYPFNANNCQGDNPMGNIFPNFMDYTKDACMNLFTKGQVQRMRDYLQFERSSLLKSKALEPTIPYDLALTRLLLDTSNVCDEFFPKASFRVTNLGRDTVRKMQIAVQWNGETQTLFWEKSIAPDQSVWLEAYQPFLKKENRLSAHVVLPATVQDGFTGNDTLRISYTCSRPLEVYPNPSADYMYLKGTEAKVSEVNVYDAQGKWTMSFPDANRMEVSQLSPGFYLMIMQTDIGIKRFPIMVQR